jgi:AraC-like DNA-binding protein
VNDLDPAILTTTGLIARLAYQRGQAAGVELELLLKKAGLTKQQVEDADIRLSVDCQIRFLNLAARALQDEFLGFHLCQEMAESEKFGLLYYAAASSDTLGEALRRVARYGSIVNEGLSPKYLQGSDIRIIFNDVGFTRHLDRHQIECWLTLLIRLCRKLTGHPVKPSRVRLTHHRSGNFSDFAAFLGCDIEFCATVDELAFPAAIADIPIVSADPYLNRLLISKLEEALSRRREKWGSFRYVVEKAIAPSLPHGNAQASKIANRCGLTQRTFARRLSSEGLTFIEVLNDLRRNLAMQYLAYRSLSISQISWLLGYQEVSAFTNAFRRWTGKTPREARLARGTPNTGTYPANQ